MKRFIWLLGLLPFIVFLFRGIAPLPGIESYYYLQYFPKTGIIISLALCIGAAALFYKLSKPLHLLVFLLSPVYISSSILFGLSSLQMFLFALGLSVNTTLAFLVFLILSFTGFFHAIIALITYAAILITNKKPLWPCIPIALMAVFTFTMPNQMRISFFSDLGGVGISIFAILLAGIGLSYIWSQKKKYYTAYWAGLLILIFSFAYGQATYANFVISFLAGAGFYFLLNRKWSLQNLKSLFAVLVFCGLAFSGISAVFLLKDYPPSNELENALMWLKQQPQGTVFSYAQNGYWITYFSNKKAYLTPDTTEKKRLEALDIMSSYDLELVTGYFKKNNIQYVLVTKDMMGPVWVREDQGLLLLLTNNEAFEKIYQNNYARIWRIK